MDKFLDRQNLPSQDSPSKSTRMGRHRSNQSKQSSSSPPLLYNDNEDSAPSQDVTSPSPSVEEMAREISKILMPLMDKKFEDFQTRLDATLTKVEANSSRMVELEQRTSDTEDAVHSLQALIDSQTQKITDLSIKIDDLENRNRRNNLRFIGIPETVKGVELLDCISKKLPEALGIYDPLKEIQIERAHRMGPERAGPRNRPRPAIAKFLDFRVKESFLRAYRQSHGLLLGEHKILVFQDYSVEVTQKRKAFSEVCQMLITRNQRFALLYPAKLRVVVNDNTLFFTDPQQAKEYFTARNLDQPA